MRHSLRARLTLTYGLLTAVALCLVASLLTYLALQFLARPMVEAIGSATARVRAIASANPGVPIRTLQERIRREAATPGVVIFFRPNAVALRNSGSPGGSPPGPPLPPPRGLAEMNLRSLIGVHGELVMLRDGAVIVAPDFQRIDRIVGAYFEGLGLVILVSVLASWFIGRWITAQAIGPLNRVTEELRRFASGDFTPRPVTTSDRSELGALIEAYNGAAAQVARAFEERKGVEQHMRRFVADAGHELRTPLTAITGFIDVLEKDGGESPTVRDRAFTILKKETRRMHGLVERLIALSRLETLEHVAASEVDVGALAVDAIKSVQAVRTGRIFLRCAGDARVYADPAGIHEAIGNLLDNALKYGGGTDVGIEIVRDGDQVVVRVCDEGPGIAESERMQIFERFYRGDNRPAVEGSGLGLAIAARAAELAGGSVLLESADPGNTAFLLRLPALR